MIDIEPEMKDDISAKKNSVFSILPMRQPPQHLLHDSLPLAIRSKKSAHDAGRDPRSDSKSKNIHPKKLKTLEVQKASHCDFVSFK